MMKIKRFPAEVVSIRRRKSGKMIGCWAFRVNSAAALREEQRRCTMSNRIDKKGRANGGLDIVTADAFRRNAEKFGRPPVVLGGE